MNFELLIYNLIGKKVHIFMIGDNLRFDGTIESYVTGDEFLCLRIENTAKEKPLGYLVIKHITAIMETT